MMDINIYNNSFVNYTKDIFILYKIIMIIFLILFSVMIWFIWWLIVWYKSAKNDLIKDLFWKK